MNLGPRDVGGRTLLVPSDLADKPEAFACHVCGASFHQDQRHVWERHVGACARANIDEIRANAPSQRNKGGPFDPDTFDPEVDEHMREVGRRMEREHRWEVLPSERAGFS